MRKDFSKFINREALFNGNDKMLLAVSGGVDSVVMAKLFHNSNYQFGIAHCNFQLRGNESDADEQMVEQLAADLDVEFYAKRFETSHYSKENKVSVQMAARELRYQWFEEIRVCNGYDLIAVAHHIDDSIETFLFNITRGSGISGLRGIQSKRDKIVRPLLFANKVQIEDFAKEQALKYCVDSSNDELKYTRNKIRHQLIPLLNELNPGFNSSIVETMKKMSETEKVFKQRIKEAQPKIVRQKDKEIFLSIEKLKQLSPLFIYLYEFLKAYNFNGSVVENLIASLDDQPGKKFFSETHCAIKDREDIIITTLTNDSVTDKDGLINEGQERIDEPKVIALKTYGKNEVNISTSDNCASLDSKKLSFPLKLRKWIQGDYFYPLGMEQKKKLSDFFIDSKIPLSEKENIFVVESAGEIAWVVGQRVDNRFKVTDSTVEIYQMELLGE